jgi:two-component system KDP operon response regulator KdpE
MISILVIEDEDSLQLLLKRLFGREGFKVFAATNGSDGMQLAKSRHIDLIILDIGLPDVNGQIVVSEIRKWSKVPIISISAFNDENTIVNILNLGADAFLPKPFSLDELNARMRLFLRKRLIDNVSERIINLGILKINTLNREVQGPKASTILSTYEYRVLSLLLSIPGKIFTHQEIINEVWGPSYKHAISSLRVAIWNIKNKIQEAGETQEFIFSVPKVGYSIKNQIDVQTDKTQTIF